MPSSKPDPESTRRAELEKLKRQSREHLDMIDEALKRTRPLVGGERKTDGLVNGESGGDANARRSNDEPPKPGPKA